MSQQCEIVQDLLPLYVDRACSEGSCEMVKQHLALCPDCSALHQRLCLDTGEERLKEEMNEIVARHGQRAKRKGILAVVLAVMLAVVLTLVLLPICVRFGSVTIDYGNSELYSAEEMESAVSLIEEKFYSWEGCKLYEIYYTDDTLCQRELDYVNTLAPDGVIYTQCIVFRTRFRSPLFGGGAWNSNAVYDWSWYMARTDGGQWELLTWGVP